MMENVSSGNTKVPIELPQPGALFGLQTAPKTFYIKYFFFVSVLKLHKTYIKSSNENLKRPTKNLKNIFANKQKMFLTKNIDS